MRLQTTYQINKYKKEYRANDKHLLYVFYFLLLIFFVLLYFYISIKTDYLYIDRIEVIGPSIFVNIDDVKTIASQHSYGKNIIWYDEEELQKILQDYFHGALDIKVSKGYFNTIKITITERVPFALIYNLEKSDYYLIDSNGYVLGIVDASKTNLPKIEYHGTIKIGEFIDSKLATLFFELISSLDSYDVPVSSATANLKDVIFYSDDIKVLFSRDKDINSSAREFSNIKKQLNSEGEDIKSVDLRFEKVIVSYD